MPRKTKIIFITVFILVGLLILGFYLYNKNQNTNNTTTTNTGFFQKFNRFSTSTKINTGTTDTNDQNTNTPDNGEISNTISKFSKLTDYAISGYTFFEEKKILPADETTTTPDSTETTPVKTKVTTAKKAIEPKFEMIPSVKYVEKSTGHVYQMNLSTKEAGKISNSTIPGVYETIFNNKADSIIYRYVSSGESTITSFLATLGGKSNFLNSNILEVSLSPDKSKFFSLIKINNGVVGNINSFEDIKAKQVFTSAFSEWLPQWVTEQSVYLTTKPSYLVEGSVFSLNVVNGTLTKILGGVSGLTTLANKDGSFILFGASLDVGPRLNIFDIKNHQSLDLGVYGLPEKCVWSNDNINIYCAIPNTITGIQYPDSWYQGVTSFEDYFVKINTKTKDMITIANSKNETVVDGTNLSLNNKEDKLFFVNKKDYTLWSLDL